MLLKRNTNTSCKDKDGMTPLHVAVENTRLGCIKLLVSSSRESLNERDNDGRTPLHIAAVTGESKICEYLLHTGAQLSSEDRNKQTPLHYAAKTGNNELLTLLYSYQASIECADIDGNTPLHLAAINGKVETVKTLLNFGVIINVLNSKNQTFFDIAIERKDSEMALAVLRHSRCEDIMSFHGADGHTPMRKLIETLPEIAEFIMDLCIQCSPLPVDHPQYAVTYDFRFLDPGPDDDMALRGDRFFAPTTMVEYKREQLLDHPLCKKLIELKWSTFGKVPYYLNFITYLAFLVAFTMYITLQRYDVVLDDGYEGSVAPQNFSNEYAWIEIAQGSQFSAVFPYTVLAFATFQLLKELFQLCLQRLKYFKDATNFLEITLYSNTLVYFYDYIDMQSNLIGDQVQWQSGTFAIFLTWLNLLLFIRRFGQMGLYVSMFFDVCKTVMKVMSVFVVFLVAFALVFFILLKEQDAFSDPLTAVIKVLAMTIGELTFSETFVATKGKTNSVTEGPLLPYPTITNTFFVTFSFMMSIILTNLLVGLAVGDIETIQKNAKMKTLCHDVDFVVEIENKYPRFISRRLYRPMIKEEPNSKGRFKCFSKIQVAMASKEKPKTKQIESEEEIRCGIQLRYERMEQSMKKQREKTKYMCELLRQQNEIIGHQQKMLTLIAKKLDISQDMDGSESRF